MPRSVNHVASKAKRTRILKLTKGYYGARKNVWTVAKNTWEKGLTYAYRDRRNKVAVPEGAAGTPPFWRDDYSF